MRCPPRDTRCIRGYSLADLDMDLHILVGRWLGRCDLVVVQQLVLDLLILLDPVSSSSALLFCPLVHWWGTHRSQQAQQQPFRQAMGKSPRSPKRRLVSWRCSTFMMTLTPQHAVAHHPRQDVLTAE